MTKKETPGYKGCGMALRVLSRRAATKALSIAGMSAFGLSAILTSPRALAQNTSQSWDAPVKGDFVYGEDSAAVTVIEYASLTCGACGGFHTQAFGQIKRELIDTGKMRFIYRHYPLDGLALRAAAAVSCLSPVVFSSMLHLLYTRQRYWVTADDPKETLIQLFGQAGINADTFEACWHDEDRIQTIVDTRLDAERRFGIEATPSFIIDGEVHRGGRPYSFFANLV
ncbi:MAG: thioredoxin domain-containing protein [Pseudomonadota bacterium]